MSKNVTKNRNGKKAKRLRRERRQKRIICALFALCIGAFAGMAVMNREQSAQSEPTQWYVVDGEMEILAAPMANTLQMQAGNGSGLPFLQPTQAPTVEPTPTAAPTPEPTAQAGGMIFGSFEAAEEPMATLEPEPTLGYSTVKITAVGDCTFGGNIPTGGEARFASYYDQYGADYFFQNVRDLFEDDDLTIVNLEGPLTNSRDMRENRKFNFRGETEYVNILTGSSVEIANVANNHALDFGQKGLYETAEVLENAGVGCSGFGREYYTEVNGVRVGSLGFTEWDYTQKQIESAVREARQNCDLLIVSIHWGTERQYTATQTQKTLGRAIIDAGADVVIGNHTHVYGGIELYKDKYIVYSLGNFCFGGNSNPADKNCLIFQQTFTVDSDGMVSDGGISLIPARVSTSDHKNDYQPYVLGAKKGQALLSDVAKVSKVSMESVHWMDDSYQARLSTLEIG